MTVSVETLNGLERKVTVSVPSEKIEKEVTLRLRNVAPKAKINGFRPGKVKPTVIRQRFSDSIRQEVARDMVQSTLFEALQTENLVPAGAPEIVPEHVVAGDDFVYSATFEVFPDITVHELTESDEVTLITAQVTDSDLDDMIERLRHQNKEYHDVSRPVKQDDKVSIDFIGFLGDEAFEGGSAEGYELVIGSGSMIPGFEEALLGAEIGKQTQINLTFPEDYGHKPLAGKDARFDVTVNSIKEGRLPEVNEAFAEKFNIKSGDVAALKKEIKENMVRELERRVSSMNRTAAFDKLLEKNKFDVPLVMINQEIENLKHEMYHQLFGHEHSDNEKIPDFPRVLFEDKARHRVQLGLLFSEYVKKHDITVESAHVDAMIEKLSSAYENPDELRDWYAASAERRAEIEALVMEDVVSRRIVESAVCVEKAKTYDQVVNPEKNKEDKGA